MQSDPALPLGLAALPLVHHAKKKLTADEIGVQRGMAIAGLPGLSQGVQDERAWERIAPEAFLGGEGSQEEQRAAVEAVAKGQFASADDRAFQVAKHTFEGLALEYASIEDIEAESTALALAGGRLVGVHWMHDKSDEALRAAAGCTASYEFETELVKHVDLDDSLAEHIDTNPHPAEGHPGRW